MDLNKRFHLKADINMWAKFEMETLELFRLLKSEEYMLEVARNLVIEE